MPTQPLSPADSRNYLGFAKQTVLGTGVVPSFFAAYIGAIAFAMNPQLRDVREAGGGSTIARQVKDFVAPAHQFAAPVRSDLAGAILAFFLGAEVLAGAGPFTHTLTPNDGRILVSTERNLADDIIERQIDAVIGQATLAYQKRDSGPELMVTAIAEGRTQEDQASPAVETYETDRPLLRSDCTWTVDTTLTPTNVESAIIDLQWALDTTILADSVIRADLVKLHLTGSVELVQLFATSDEADAYRRTHYWDGAAAGTVPGELVYPGDLQVVASFGTGAATRAVDVLLPNLNWGEAELTPNDPDASEAVRLTRRAAVIGPDPAVTIVVTNSRATAYI